MFKKTAVGLLLAASVSSAQESQKQNPPIAVLECQDGYHVIQTPKGPDCARDKAISTAPLSKKEEEKVLAMELRRIRNVCVAPPELADGSQDYSAAGELAKVLRDYVNWEATVCEVEYHAGRTVSVKNREHYDAYLQLSRSDNSFVSTSDWQSSSVSVVLTPTRSVAIEGVSRFVEGHWSYTNTLWNPDAMVGVAKKIKKSIGH